MICALMPRSRSGAIAAGDDVKADSDGQLRMLASRLEFLSKSGLVAKPRPVVVNSEYAADEYCSNDGEDRGGDLNVLMAERELIVWDSSRGKDACEKVASKAVTTRCRGRICAICSDHIIDWTSLQPKNR